jgi:hypothetical protein
MSELLGHVPPHAGVWEMVHVSLSLAHTQVLPPDVCPQTSPLGHVPPQVGAGDE